MQKNSVCKICGSNRIRTIKKYYITKELNPPSWQEVFDWVKGLPYPLSIRLGLCLNCGFLFYLDTLSYKEMKQFYEEESRYNRPKEHKLKPGRRWEIDRLLKFLDKNLPQSQIETGLDLGAGDFIALKRIIKLITSIRFEAVDPSYPTNNHKGIKVYQTMIEDLKLSQVYDFVTAIHILEHVGDLNKFFAKTKELVRDNGYLYIEVPFEVGPGLLLNRGASAQHINYFTPSTMSYLLTRQGFHVKALEFDTEAYIHTGMAGMIRVLAQKKKTSLDKSNTAETVRYILNPFLIIRTKLKASRVKSKSNK